MWHCTNISTALKFFRKRPPLAWRKFGRVATIPGCAVYNSVMSAAESLLYGRRIANTQIHPQPLFVIGHWRGGTTLLRAALPADSPLCRDGVAPAWTALELLAQGMAAQGGVVGAGVERQAPLVWARRVQLRHPCLPPGEPPWPWFDRTLLERKPLLQPNDPALSDLIPMQQSRARKGAIRGPSRGL